MTSRGLEDLDRGLGSCLPSDDLPLLEEPRSGRRSDSKARGTSRRADSSSWMHVLQDPVTAADVKPKAEGSGTGPETPKAGTSPRSAPARRKSQPAPPPKPPPPPPSQDLPWGDLTLNKCLALASLLALLGSALQLCRDAVAGEAPAAPQQWVPPSSSPKKPAPPTPQPPVSAPPSGPPVRQAQTQDEPELPRSPEAAEAPGEPGGPTPDSGEERAPLGDRESQERPRKEKPRKGERLKKEKRRGEERPRASREPRQSLPRRWEAREGGRRPRDSGEPGQEKRQAWAPPRRHDGDHRPRQKLRGGKGRD